MFGVFFLRKVIRNVFRPPQTGAKSLPMSTPNGPSCNQSLSMHKKLAQNQWKIPLKPNNTKSKIIA